MSQSLPATQPNDPALDPPPISLHLANATSAQLAAALSKELNLPVTLRMDPLDSKPGVARAGIQNPLITIDVEQQPFWEVIAQLSQQQLVRLVINQQAIANVPFRRYVRQGPFLIQVVALTYNREIRPQGDEQFFSHADGLLRVDFLAAPDPRLKVILSTPGLTYAQDDAGNSLLEKPIADPETVSPLGAATAKPLMLKMPARPGKTLTLKGAAEFTVQVTEKRMEIADLQKQVAPVSFAGAVVSFAPAPEDPLSIVITTKAADGQTYPTGLRFTITDAGGNEAMSFSRAEPLTLKLPLSEPIRRLRGPMLMPAPPFKLTLSVPDKTQKVTVPYEFKDLPLPQ